jgi:hypothetical protein
MSPHPSRRLAPAFALGSLLLAGLPSQAASVSFELFQAEGASSTQAEAFCTGNKIVGGVINTSGVPTGAAMSTTGAFKPFTLPNAKITRPHACYQGQVMGSAFYGPYGLRMKGFVATPKGVLSLLPPGGSNASVQGMNAAGTIVGLYSAGSRGYNSGFIYRDGSYTRYDLPGALGTQIMGITEAGALIGSYVDKQTGQSSGFVDQGGSVTRYHVPGSYDTLITGTNAQGVLVGHFNLELGGGHQGFYYANGQYITVAPEGALDTYVWSIDDQGRLVGYSYYDNYGQSAFVARVSP